MRVVLSDAELLEMFRKNNTEGYRMIVRKYQERIYWQIRRITKNHQDTEDVLQSVFIKAWKGLGNFREESTLYTWLYRLAFNETFTFMKKESKRKAISMDPPLFENQVVVQGKNFSPEEIETILTKALATLPEKQLMVFNLRYFDELKFSEITELTGTTEGGLKASYHIAVKKIEYFINGI